jgi:hypothetical protein
MSDNPGAPSQELSLPDSGILGLPERFQPRNMTELMAWSKMVVGSGLAPKGMNEAGVVLAVQMGAELSITPTQALQNIAVINGRPSIWGDLGLALFRRDSRYESFEERAPDECKKQGEGYCRIVMRDGREIVRRFSREDAKAAKLHERSGPTGPWNTYEGRMLMFRSRWWAMRDADPGVFKGCAAREEQEDIRDITGEIKVDGKPTGGPRRRSEAAEVSGAEVEKFLKEAKPAPILDGGGTSRPAAVVDRSKLLKVLIKDSLEKTGNGKAFYVLQWETSAGQKAEATTFDRAHHDTATACKGAFALLGTKESAKKDSKGNPYVNVAHIEPADQAQASEAPPPQDEPGANG